MTLLLCERCGDFYDEAKSTAELRLTFCSGICEGRELGRPVSDWTRFVHRKPEAELAKRLMREFHLKNIHGRAEGYKAFFEAMKKAGGI